MPPLILSTDFDGIYGTYPNENVAARARFLGNRNLFGTLWVVSNENINGRRTTCLHFSDFGFIVSPIQFHPTSP